MEQVMAAAGHVITAVRERASALVVGVSLATVAATTGFISYTHISALTISEHQSWKSAHLYPLAVDGQIAIGSVVLMVVKGRHRWWGLIGFIPGLAESLIANWASGWSGHPAVMAGRQVIEAATKSHDLGAALWATVPAQAFACSTFLFEMWLRHRVRAWTGSGADSGDAVAEAESLLAELEDETIPQAPVPAAPGPVPVAVHLHAAPEGAPWGLVSPAAAPVPEPARPAVPVLGPVMSLSQRPKPARRQRPQAVPDADDERLPWPQDEDEQRELVNSMSRNKLFETYRLSKYAADRLREQYLEEVA